jgi:uncharacterized membrane protein
MRPWLKWLIVFCTAPITVGAFILIYLFWSFYAPDYPAKWTKFFPRNYEVIFYGAILVSQVLFAATMATIAHRASPYHASYRWRLGLWLRWV